MEGSPCFGVNLGFEGGLERTVRVIRAGEIGVADEEAFSVVVGVYEPASYAFGAIADYFSGLGLEHIDTFHLHAYLACVDRLPGDQHGHNRGLARPVANLSASRLSPGLASLFAFARCSRKPFPAFEFGATSVSHIAVSTASTWQKNGRMSLNL